MTDTALLDALVAIKLCEKAVTAAIRDYDQSVGEADQAAREEVRAFLKEVPSGISSAFIPPGMAADLADIWEARYAHAKSALRAESFGTYVDRLIQGTGTGWGVPAFGASEPRPRHADEADQVITIQVIRITTR